MNDKRNASLRDALLKAVAIAAFTAVPATAFAPIASATVYHDDINDGDCDLDAASDTGAGSSDNPFRISTVEDLAEITDCDYDGYFFYEMSNDIDITPNGNYNNDGFEWNGLSEGWSPIGEAAVYDFDDVTGDPYYVSNDFNGNFNGNGYTISGLIIDNDDNQNDYLGLFSEMDEATIENLTIEGEIDGGYDDIDGDYADWVGMLAGYDYQSTVTNVHAVVDIYDVDDNVGGLIGEAEDTRISNSSTSGTIEGTIDESVNMGGLVGYADDYNTPVRLTDVSSSVDINDFSDGQDNGSYFEDIGGLVGNAEALRVNRATFSGSLFGNDNVGGIVGGGDDIIINNTTVTEDAQIEVEEDDYVYDIGGIVGQLDGGSSLTNVTFAGSINATTDGYDVESIGGIAGYAYYSNIVGAVVTSEVEISAKGYDSDSDNLGGIVGYADETSIASVANYADIVVSEIEHVGGIAGELDQSVVSGSVNRGNIHVTIDDDDSSFDEGAFGGIVGYLDYESEVSTSTNKGDIIADGSDDPWAVGGIVGYANNEGNTVLDNYNTGDVTGVYNVAGVIGYTDDEDTVIQRNYNVGLLTAYDSDADGITTIDYETETILDPTNAVLLSDRADNVTDAMELTAAELKAGLDLVAAGWEINLQGGSVSDSAKWKTETGFNSGYPSLVWETVSEDINEPVGLSDVTWEDAVQFNGGKRFLLTLEERNFLNSVAATINAHAFDSVDVDVYYGSKYKLAGKRAKAVKRYLVRRFVGTPITVHIMPADGGHAVGSVHISALVD